MTKGSYRGTEISKYYQSFSGTDTLAFIMLPGCTPVFIGSLTTISYSMYRNKKPVINIGRTNINGVTRGSRIYAGTMIFTLINQHWLREIQEQQEASWLSPYTELKADEMPLFDIMIISANEYGNAVTMYIWGIDITDEAQTISVEDLFTENTFSFIARDVTIFKNFNIFLNKTGSTSHAIKSEDPQRFFILDNSNITFSELGKLAKEFAQKTLIADKKIKKRALETLARILYYSTSNTMMGNDVAKLQELLAKIYPETVINGIFDKATDSLVRKFQASHNYSTIDGIVDDKLYNILLDNIPKSDMKVGLVINKNGAFVYAKPTVNSNIVDTRPYHNQMEIYSIVPSIDDTNDLFYKTDTGYIQKRDMFSAFHEAETIEFPIIKYGDSSNYVTTIQSILAGIYKDFTNITGLYDNITQHYIKNFQVSNGLKDTGIVDYQTWLLLKASENEPTIEDNFEINFNTLPGIYNLTGNIKDFIEKFTSQVSCDNYINVKYSTVSIFDNGESDIITNTTSVKGLLKIALNPTAFLYNPKIGKTPKQVDFIIYPYNKQAYKWSIMLGGEK